MSILTPCEQLGYKVGDVFTATGDGEFMKGSTLTLSRDDGSRSPLFTGEGSCWFNGPEATPGAYESLNDVVKVESK